MYSKGINPQSTLGAQKRWQLHERENLGHHWWKWNSGREEPESDSSEGNPWAPHLMGDLSEQRWCYPATADSISTRRDHSRGRQLVYPTFSEKKRASNNNIFTALASPANPACTWLTQRSEAALSSLLSFHLPNPHIQLPCPQASYL